MISANDYILGSNFQDPLFSREQSRASPGPAFLTTYCPPPPRKLVRHCVGFIPGGSSSLPTLRGGLGLGEEPRNQGGHGHYVEATHAGENVCLSCSKKATGVGAEELSRQWGSQATVGFRWAPRKAQQGEQADKPELEGMCW